MPHARACRSGSQPGKAPPYPQPTGSGATHHSVTTWNWNASCQCPASPPAARHTRPTLVACKPRQSVPRRHYNYDVQVQVACPPWPIHGRPRSSRGLLRYLALGTVDMARGLITLSPPHHLQPHRDSSPFERHDAITYLRWTPSRGVGPVSRPLRLAPSSHLQLNNPFP